MNVQYEMYYILRQKFLDHMSQEITASSQSRHEALKLVGGICTFKWSTYQGLI